MSDCTRRRLLAAGGVAAMGAIAGCSSGSADDEEEDDGESETAEGTLLGDVSVENLHADEHTVDVIVEFDSEIEHWSTHHLDAESSGADLERDWPTDPGSFRVTARLDEEELTQVTPAKWNDPACLNLTIVVGRSGDFRVLSDTSGGPCDEGAPNGDGGDGE